MSKIIVRATATLSRDEFLRLAAERGWEEKKEHVSRWARVCNFFSNLFTEEIREEENQPLPELVLVKHMWASRTWFHRENVPISPDGKIRLRKVAFTPWHEGVWVYDVPCEVRSYFRIDNCDIKVEDDIPPEPTPPQFIIADAADGGICETCHGSGFWPYGCDQCGCGDRGY